MNVNFEKNYLEEKAFWEVYLATNKKNEEDEFAFDNHGGSSWFDLIKNEYKYLVDGKYFNIGMWENMFTRTEMRRIDKSHLKFNLRENKLFFYYLSMWYFASVLVLFFIFLISPHFSVKYDMYSVADMFFTYSLLWWIFTCAYLLYFRTLLLYPHALNALADHLLVRDAYEIFTLIGKCLLSARFFTIFYHLMRDYTDSPFCYESYMLSDDLHRFMLINFQNCFDIYQCSFYTVLPYPIHWFLAFYGLNFIEILLRIYGCGNIAYLSKTVDNKWVLVYGIIVVYLFIFVVLILSVAFPFQRNMKVLHLSTQYKIKFSLDRKQVVEKRCKFMKSLAQQQLSIFHDLRALFRMNTSTIFFSPDHPLYTETSKLLLGKLSNVKRNVFRIYNLMNHDVENLMFLMKVQEGRYQWKFRDKISLIPFVEDVIGNLQYTLSGDGHNHVNARQLIDIEDLFHVHFKFAKPCLSMLLSYSLFIIVTILLREIPDVESFLENHNSYFHLVSLCCCLEKKDEAFKGNLMDDKLQILKFELAIPLKYQDIFRRSYSSQASRQLIESACTTCYKLVDLYKGKWKFTAEKISFTIICEFPMEINRLDSISNDTYDVKVSHFGMGGSSTNLDADDETLPRDLRFKSYDSNDNDDSFTPEEKKLALKMIQEICIYIDNVSLESFILDILPKLPGGNRISVVRHLTIADLKYHAIVFVQSIEACTIIKEKKKDVCVVLFSERLNYLDEGVEAYFDYGVSVPCGDSELLGLVEWLTSKLLGQTNHANLPVNEDTANRSEKGDETHHMYESFADQVISQSVWSWGMRIKLDSFLLENYTRWRYYIPKVQRFHHNRLLTMSLFVYAIFHLCLLLTNQFQPTFNIGAMIFYCLIFFRHRIYWRLLEPLGVKFRSWIYFWFSGMALILTLCAITYLPDGFQGHKMFTVGIPTIKSLADQNVTAVVQEQEYLKIFYGQYLIREGTITYLNSAIYVMTIADYLPWPASLLCFLGAAIRIILYFETYISWNEFFQLLTHNLFLMTTLTMICYKKEKLARVEFVKVYNTIMDKILFESSLMPINYNVQACVNEIDSIQQEMYDILTLSIQTHHIKTNNPLVLKLIHAMQSHLAKAKRFQFELKISKRYNYLEQRQQNILADMKAYFLRDLIYPICSSYIDKLDSHDIPVKFYLRLYPQLTMVRTYDQLITSILHFLLQNAMERIQYTVQHDKGCHIAHEILIWIQPVITLTGGQPEVNPHSTVHTDSRRGMGNRSNATKSLLSSANSKSQRPKGSKDDDSDSANSLLDDEDEPGTNLPRNVVRGVDIRALKITILDTGRLEYLPKTAGVMEVHDVIENTNNRHEPIHFDTHFEEALGYDKFVEYFNLPINLRYSVGSVKHHKYKCFQTIGMPYLPATDSKLIESYVSNERKEEEVIGGSYHHPNHYNQQLLSNYQYQSCGGKIETISRLGDTYFQQYHDAYERAMVAVSSNRGDDDELRQQYDLPAENQGAGASQSATDHTFEATKSIHHIFSFNHMVQQQEQHNPFSVVTSFSAASVASSSSESLTKDREIGSVSNISSQSAVTTKSTSSFDSQFYPWKDGKVILLGNFGGELHRGASKTQAHFADYLWKVHSYFRSFPQLPPHFFQHADIIIVEYDKFNMNQVTYDIRSLLHYFRTFQYTGLLIVASHPMIDINSDIMMKKLSFKNVYADACQADWIVSLPLDEEKIQQLVHLSYQRKFSCMLTNHVNYK